MGRSTSVRYSFFWCLNLNLIYCVFRGVGYSTADSEGYSKFIILMFYNPWIKNLHLILVADEDQMGEDFVRYVQHQIIEIQSNYILRSDSSLIL